MSHGVSRTSCPLSTVFDALRARMVAVKQGTDSGVGGSARARRILRPRIEIQ